MDCILGCVLNSSASDIFMFLAKHHEDEISLDQIQDYLRLIYPNVEHIEIEDILKCIHYSFSRRKRYSICFVRLNRTLKM